jgi:heat shock protein HtpX
VIGHKRYFMGKRILLFVVVNALILLTISIVLSVLGIRPYITAQGIDYGALMIFCLLWGMGGAFISLGLSRIMAKWLMGVKLIDPRSADPRALEVREMVHRLSRAAGLSTMPEVGIYESPEINAFATGPTKNRSLVAVSSGLLRGMNRDAVEGVIGHEVAHITNGDMVTMTLIQGIVNAFVLFFARIIAFVVSQRVPDSMRFIVHIVAVIVFQILFSILGMFVVAWFSRKREFRADRGGATLAGRGSMLAALTALQRSMPVPDDRQASVATLKISSTSRSGLAVMLSTHPPIEERIRRLQEQQ